MVVIEEIMEDGKIIIIKNLGDFVVCNFFFINLVRVVIEDVFECLILI